MPNPIPLAEIYVLMMCWGLYKYMQLWTDYGPLAEVWFDGKPRSTSDLALKDSQAPCE